MDWKDVGEFMIDLPCSYGNVHVRATKKVWEAIHNAIKSDSEYIEFYVNDIPCGARKYFKLVLDGKIK
ncbi:hypothetical protein ES703_29025 [subsurface metagenome]